MISRIKNRHLFFIDLLLLALTPTIALSLRLQIPWDPKYIQPLLFYTALSLVIKLAVFYFAGIYRQFWRYASVDALLTIVWGVGAASLISAGLVFAVYGCGLIGTQSIPRSIPLIDGMLTLIVVGGTRLSLRIVEYQSGGDKNGGEGKRVLIAGAGDAGRMVAREIRTGRYPGVRCVGFADDDPRKIGTMIHNLPVLGALGDIPDLLQLYRVEEVIIAMPSVSGDVIRKVVDLCEQHDVTPKTLPGIFELLSGEVGVSRLRDVEVGDLLRRQPVSVDPEPVEEFIKGKRVLVTGAGGSIGAELCQQIIQCQPAKLLALGHGENSLFRLPKKIGSSAETLGAGALELVVADIRDTSRMEVVFSRYRPQIVFHAAAHKHVPLMEKNLEDAITNNILGTRNLVERAVDHGVERFVSISTDKAVEPVSVMGMTKRIAEWIVQHAAEDTGRPYVSVRFGNVLGSRGSVVPLFQRQIAAGGPVTVTHPEMERFFMTVSEAVQLVLQAAALGENGEIFVLDMGEQIKIKELAEQVIELSGLRVGVDMQIVYTGLRSGEKLSEKLYAEDEIVSGTKHEKIMKIHPQRSLDGEAFRDDVDHLIHLAQTGARDRARELLMELSTS